MKKFNITGTCIPEKHYMVDISSKLDEITELIENDNHTGMDIMAVSEELYFYTSGYPFLVSRLCKWIDEDGNKDWTKAGVGDAEKELLKCRNTLFDDLIKNVENNKDLNQIITTILYDGYTQGFNLSDPAIEKGAMLGILSEKDHKVAVSNVIFETYLYDYLVSVNSRKNGIIGDSCFCVF